LSACAAILLAFERGVVGIASSVHAHAAVAGALWSQEGDVLVGAITCAPNLVLAYHPRCFGFRFRRISACTLGSSAMSGASLHLPLANPWTSSLQALLTLSN
jgi:hypothetical protein